MPRTHRSASKLPCGRCHLGCVIGLLLFALSLGTLVRVALLDSGHRWLSLSPESIVQPSPPRAPVRSSSRITGQPSTSVVSTSTPAPSSSRSVSRGPDRTETAEPTGIRIGSSKASSAQPSSAPSISDAVSPLEVDGCHGNKLKFEVVELKSGLHAVSCRVRAHASQLFVAVTSPVGNFNLRMALREGHWLMSTFPAPGRASYMFFVGGAPDQDTQTKVSDEMNRFGDIVQLDLADKFTNLAVKSVAAAAWMNSQLDTSIVRYFLKVEDYMSNDFGHIDELVSQLSAKEDPAPYYGGGMIFGDTPVVRDSRWGCPKHHCPYKTYPAVYAGGQYMLSSAAVRVVTEQGLPALDLKDPYPIEDHYLASVLAKAGIRVKSDPKLMWAGGKPYGAPSIVKGDFLLCLDTEDRPQVTQGQDGVWEGSTLVVPPGTVVTEAWYGDPAHQWISTHGKNVTESVLKTLRKGRAVKAGASGWGDPAPGIRKVLVVKMSRKHAFGRR